ncbi:MAG: DNA topoisomerase IB [Bryobacterales bacterium]|nr:DNA topoisomerase IB [Bryobacterales bacterium]
MLTADPLASAKAAHLRYVTGRGPGIIRKRHGKGFAYIGVDGKAVSDKATLQRIRSLVIPPAWENVWICPFEHGHIQAMGRDARGRKQYRYHPRYREVRDETKFGRMLAFGAALPKIREQVDKDLSLHGLPQRKVVAAIVRLLDETCIRIGNEEYAKSNKSFGLTTLRDRHADIQGASVHFHFRGKSNQEHDITLRDRRLATVVKRCQDLPGQELFQYQTETGESARVDSTDVNEYLREITQEDFTAKDFRTWHGTGHMAQNLAALGPASTERETKHNIVEAVKETAKHLGNRPAACRKYYIHPAVFDSYTEQTIFAVIGNLPDSPSAAVGELRPLETAVIRLVEAYVSSAKKKAG